MIAMVFVVCSAFSSQMVMPMWVGAVITDYHVSAQAAGLIASLELAMVAVVSVLAAPLVSRVDRRLLCLLGIVLLMIGNAGSATTQSVTFLAVLRVLCGCGKGLAVVGIFSAVAQTRRPTRGFAILNGAYAAFSAFYFLAIPHEIRALGARGAFRAILAVTSVSLLLLYWVPAGHPQRRATRAAGSARSSSNGALVLAALAMMWIGYNAVWIFVQRLGADHGLSLETIGKVLAAGAVLTIAGPFLAHMISTRFGLTAPLVTGFIGLGCLAVTLISPTGAIGFYLAAPAFSLVGLFIVPYIMGVLSEIDGTGKLAAVGSSAMTLGGALGSLIGGVALTQFGHAGLYASSLGLFGLVLIVITPVALRIDRIQSVAREEA